MQPTFFSLLLVALYASVPTDCRPRPREADQLEGDTTEEASPGHLHLDGPGRRTLHGDPLVILPVRTETSNFVSIFGLRRKRFLCMNSKGELYNSRERDREDCLFQRIWLDVENRRDVFYSSSGGRLLHLRRAGPPAASQEPLEPSPAVLRWFLAPLVRRQRRSEGVNPSDPLRTQADPSVKGHTDTDQRPPEQDRGAVSKETITSCDDPLRVLQPNGHISPLKTNVAERAQQD